MSYCPVCGGRCELNRRMTDPPLSKEQIERLLYWTNRSRWQRWWDWAKGVR